ncbi:MAG: hypothetical protein NC218_02355 [Acetobacter sp.]|nr:hypothetical protein [Acetobacter sp.]
MAENYVQKDFASIYEDLLTFVESSTTKWKPRNSTEADPGVLILKLIALLEDKCGYRFDMARNQGYLDGVSDRESAYELLKELGYLMKNARAATGYIELLPDNYLNWTDLSDAQLGVIMPRFTVITDATKTLKYFTTKEFYTLRTTVIDDVGSRLKPGLRFRVPVQAGEPFQITKEGFDYFTLKDVDEQGRLYLGKSNLAQNGVFVFTRQGDGEDKELVDDWTYLDFAILKPKGNWYEVHTSDNSEVYVQFPSNFEELIGTRKLEVWATYTEGAASNISKGMLSQFEDSEFKRYFAIQQTKDIYSGQDAESISLATENYYATKDICNTIITANDFENAIRYLLVSLTSEKFPVADNRYFSNVVVTTANDRKTKVRTICKGTEYTLFEPDITEPSNQIDVIAMRASDDYSTSFQQITDAEEKELIEADIEQQLQDNVAADVDIKIDIDTKRLLAVTTPEITIRVQNYTTQLDAQIREKVKNYFYSTYKADNLTAGKPLDFQTIYDDIKALSPAIVSVTIPEFQYKICTSHKNIEGETVEAFTKSTVDTAPTDLAIDSLARAVLQGDVPLFKFKNRQNTRTKQMSAYALLSAQDDSMEPVQAIPWNAKDAEPVAEGKLISPVVSSVVFNHAENGVNGVLGPNAEVNTFLYLRSANELLQFRKPLYVATDVYSYGMNVTFDTMRLEDDVTITKTSLLKSGTVCGGKTSLVLSGNIKIDGDGISVEDGKYKFSKTLTLTKDIEIEKGSLLVATTSLAPGSIIDGVTYDEVIVPRDTEYMLKENQRIVITNSAGEGKVTLTKGDVVSISGMDLKTTTLPVQLNSTAQLSVLGSDVSTASTDFVYVLSLRSSKKNLTITHDKPYMLEEGEVFVYADKGVTEYITLGPGTVLSVAKGSSCELKNTPYKDFADITVEEFEQIPVEIIARAYELTSFLAAGHNYTLLYYLANRNPDEYSGTVTNEWQQIPEPLWLADLPMADGAVDLSVLREPDAKELILKLADTSYQVRVVFSIDSDSNGVGYVYAPCSLVLSTQQSDGTYSACATISASGNANVTKNKAAIISTAPFSGIFTGTAENNNQYLLSSGAARFVTTQITINSDQLETAVGVYDIDLPLSFATALEGGDYDWLSPSVTFFDGAWVSLLFVDTSELSDLDASITFGGSDDASAFVCSLDDFLSGVAASKLSTKKKEERVVVLHTLKEKYKDYCGKILVAVRTQQPAEGSSSVSQQIPIEISGIIIPSEDKDTDGIRSKTMHIKSLSILDAFATELLPVNNAFTEADYRDGNSFSRKLLKRISELDIENRFNVLALPSEKYADPLSAASVLIDGHPLNERAFPYLDLHLKKIKVVKER